MSTENEVITEKPSKKEEKPKGGGVIEFVKESYEEVTQQVTWTKTSELYSSTTLVLVASLIFALVIGGIDFLFKEGLRIFYEYIVK